MGSWSLPDEPLDDLEDSGAPTPAPVTPDEVPPAPTEEEEPQEPEEKARRREWEAAKGIAAVAPVRREPLPQKRGCRRGRKNGSSLFRGVNFHKPSGRWLARVYIKRKAHFLGEYNDEEMAAEAFDKAVIKIRGKHAVTNFPAEEYAEEMRSMGASEISVEEFICELRREAKEDKLKGAKNSYNLFYDHVLDRVKEDLMADLAEGEKLTVQATTCAIAALWREQDKETKEEWQARAKELRAAVDQTPERAAVEVGPSTSRGGKAAGADGPGPSKRPRHEGEGEAAKGIAAVAPVRREPLPQKRGRGGPKNRSSIYCGVCKSRGSWEARVFIKECVACGTKTTPQWRNIESKAYCVSP